MADLGTAYASTGRVFLVGAGPGDAELLTLKARRLLSEAEVVVYDYLVSPDILAMARPGAELIHVGKKGGGFCTPQSEIDSLLVRLGREGRRVVRLKGGDPFIFGRGGEEAEALVHAGVAFEVVPGVTSALASAGYAGIPLTHRAYSSGVILLTGHEDPAKPSSTVSWEAVAKTGLTLCIYMGVKNLPVIAARLQAGGLSAGTPAAVIQQATTSEHRQVVADLGTIAEEARKAGVEAPAIVIIGEVTRFATTLNWFDPSQVAALAL